MNGDFSKRPRLERERFIDTKAEILTVQGLMIAFIPVYITLAFTIAEILTGR